MVGGRSKYTHSFGGGGGWLGPPCRNCADGGIDITVRHLGHMARLVFMGSNRVVLQQTQMT